jgi:hypothetical protein
MTVTGRRGALPPKNDKLMSQGDELSSSDAQLRTRNESRETRAGRIVIMHPDSMAVVRENPQSFSTVHNFETRSSNHPLICKIRSRSTPACLHTQLRCVALEHGLGEARHVASSHGDPQHQRNRWRHAECYQCLIRPLDTHGRSPSWSTYSAARHPMMRLALSSTPFRPPSGHDFINKMTMPDNQCFCQLCRLVNADVLALLSASKIQFLLLVSTSEINIRSGGSASGQD